MGQKPNVLIRAKYAWKFFRVGFKYFNLGKPEVKAGVPYVWPDFLTGQPQWSIIDYGSYAQEGFNENAVIYSAIMYKVRSLTSAPLRAYRGTEEEPELLPPENALQQFVARPNPWQSWSEFQGLAEVYFNLAGNVYIYLDKEETPWEMYLLRPDQVKIVPHPEDDKDILGFFYIPVGKTQEDAVPFLPKDIIHIRLPNPLDPLDGLGYGLSPLSPAARSTSVDNQVTRFLKIFFEKGIVIPGLLSFDYPIDDADAARARERWQEMHGGVGNWADIAVLGRGGKYQRVGLTFDEMGFAEIDERNESRMAGPFGVPPILIGTRLGLTRSSYGKAYEEARKAFWEDTMTPELRIFETEYQHYLNNADEFVMFDLSKVPALSPSPVEKIIRAKDAFISGGITRNEYRAAIGLGPIEGGDVYLVPVMIEERPVGELPVMGVLELPAPAALLKEPEPKLLQEEEEGGKAMSEESKEALWKVFDAQARKWEDAFGKKAIEAFEKDKRAILAIVSDAKKKALKNKATVAWAATLLEASHYFTASAPGNWRNLFIPVLSGLIIDRGERLNVDFGMEFDVRNLLAEEWFDAYKIKFATDINATSEEQIRGILQQGMEEGWSIPEMSKNLETTFEQWMEGDRSPEDFEWLDERMPKYRREAIARTETIKCSNAGSNALYKDWGVEKKEWLTQIDGRQRPSHEAANGDVVEIGGRFEVGGCLMEYPGDCGDPREVVNCRCTVIPVI